MPTRRSEAASTGARERVLARDMDAYKRLRRDGVQPRQIDGSHVLEQRAETRTEIERGLLNA